MKIVPCNVQGLGNPIKRSFIRKDLGLINMDWVTLQETKFRLEVRYMVEQICGKKDWSFDSLDHFIGLWDCHNFTLFRNFNVLRFEERIRLQGFVSAYEDFALLIELFSLQDLPLVRLDFTFFEGGFRGKGW